MDIGKRVRPHVLEIERYQPGENRDGAVKLSSNENPRPPHPKIIAAVVAALQESNRYPASGSPELTRALSLRHGVSADEVVVGNGSNELIDLIVRAFVGSNENVVYPVPSFIAYALVAKVCGCQGVGVPCRDYRLDLAAMRAAVSESTRVVFVCNPNNPTSTYVTASELVSCLDSLPRDVLVVLDEAYIDYVNAPDFPDSLTLRRGRDNVVVMRTFSKFFAIAGVRAGYALAHPVVADAMHRVRQPFNVSRLAQAAGLAALACAGDLAPYARETIAERERVRDAILSLGPACPPSQTNFVFADLGASEFDLFAALSERGVIVRRLGQFGAAKNAYRITVGTPAENDLLIEALRAVLHRPSAASRARPASS